MTVYSLKERKESAELHLFEARTTEPGKCVPAIKSICKKMSLSETAHNVFLCYDEDSARNGCASAGRKVCGVCVSSLYASYL